MPSDYLRRQGGGNDKYARYGWTAADRGFLAMNYSPEVAGTGNVPVAGTLYLVKLRLQETTSVTNVILGVQTAGGTLTSGQNFAMLFTEANVRIGVTADQTTAWGSTGVKTMALASGPFTCVAGNYYVAMYANGTTTPAFNRAGVISSVFNNVGTAAPTLLWATADTGLTTTLPTTFGAQTGTLISYWAALS